MRPIFIFLLLSFTLSSQAQKVNIKKQLKFAAAQTRYMLEQIQTTTHSLEQVSPRTYENGKLKMVASRDWTSGFFPGELWLLYQATGDPQWKTEARKFTQQVEQEKMNTGTHDLGFMIYCSFGNAYKITHDDADKAVIVRAARSLATRFNPRTGVIRSWDHNKDKWTNPVIIDNMMNLELLFEATHLTGDSSFYKIAVSHANTTLKNHFRPDYSSYHVVDYDPEIGKVIKKTTAQGYSNESAWARGQAWGLYGYAMCYRYTHDPRYLEQAEHIAGFILNHPNLPKDKIPYWDFNDPAIPNAPRDASAAAITASALFELASESHNPFYKQTANEILYNLSHYYRSHLATHSGFLLLHSTGHKPAHSEIDVPIIYADYYYLETLLRAREQ